MVSVDGGPATQTDIVLSSAPFQPHVIEAAAGNALAPGVRSGFQGWEDGSPRVRTFVTQLEDSVLTATYGGDREILLAVTTESPFEAVDPGQIETIPSSVDGWFDEGTDVSITATARTGFEFERWTGDLTGSPNPVLLTLDAPITATAEYDVTFGVGEAAAEAELEAAVASQVVLEAVNANPPVQWSVLTGPLPSGVTLSPEGVIGGVAMESGVFDISVRAEDGIGLVATAPIRLMVLPPNVGAQSLGAPFYGLGVGPTASQLEYLDRNGNANGRYDLGDFRAFVLANPDLPDGVAAPAAVARASVVRVPLQFRPEEESR